jgi:hypothetical protein
MYKIKFLKLPLILIMVISGFAPAYAGDYIKKTFKLDKFTQVKIATRLNVDIMRSNKQYVLIKANKDYFKDLILEVRNETLIIRTKYNKKRHRFPLFGARDEKKIYISLPMINSVNIAGSGNVRIKGMDTRKMKIGIEGSGKVLLMGKCQRLYVDIYGSGVFNGHKLNCDLVDFTISGAGMVELEGQCKKIEVIIKGHAEFDAEDLKCDTGEVTFNGAGYLNIHANKSVEVDIKGSGVVDVYGNPENFSKTIVGDGHVSIN